MNKPVTETPKKAAASEIDGKKTKAQKTWEKQYAEKGKEREALYETISGDPVKPLYTPADSEGRDYDKKIGYPGEYPYTRGIHPTMYRGRLFTMRQFSGMGSAKQTNERFHYLLKHGQTGLSIAFDVPTLMGYDSDDPRALGEVGICGVAVDSLADMEVLFKGIPIGDITTSMTVNGPAAIIWALFLAAAEKQGVPFEKIGGTLQNDCFKEFVAQKCWCFPPRPAVRLVVNTIEFGTKEMPRWNTISVSGYHIREAGSTAAQELAFTLKDGFTYVEEAMKAGLDIDDFAPRLSYFFNAHTMPGTCGRSTEPRTRARGSSVSTPRRPAARSPRNSPRTTSSAPPSRPCPACSAAPSRCTPTPWMRLWRCPRITRSRLRSAPSRSSPSRAESPARSIRWPVPTTSRP
jgi:methylmalonyl-CoA mutase N-terminal domain/subunit